MSNITLCTGNYVEYRVSDCMYGCKIYKCDCCGHEKIIHNSTYGCRKAE